MTELPAELLPGTRRALLHQVALAQSEGRAPAVVAGVVRDGQLVWSGARSMIDGHAPTPDVQFRIGSLTKTFVAVLVLRLRDEGLLDLGDPLGRHLPGTPADAATVAQLLAHSAGLAAETPPPWWERTEGALRPELADLLDAESPVKHPAGRRHHYSNPGYALLGALVERLRGEPWGEVLRREVLAPLGMDRTTLLPEHPHAGGFAVHPWADVMLPEPLTDTGLMGPAGQLWSTGADLARWAAFLAAGDDKVLGADSLAEMRRPAVGPEDADWTSAFGLGLQLRRHEGRVLYGHSGSMPGFTAGIWISEADGLAAFALANATSGANTPQLAARLIALTAEHEPRLPEPWRPLPEVDEDLLALTGPWYWGAMPNVLRLRPGRVLELTPLADHGRAARFRPQPDGTWLGLDRYYAGETLRVVRNSDGTVGHLDVGSFVYTREPYGPGGAVPGGVDPQGWRAL
ncbi:serine hydrolase [Streptomyces rubellomurinus]|uniref:Beta-lactamase n=2 Tax=Streptomyces TaxID=1883 RepID=A0A0F2TGM4_STRR3|nr:serine hydrolase domain-containing protein [Streptomyces rubellomurinus]KJS53627.1 beta-lactamase [Streptomyces rubellomurinus subsp. indigoferus]KJS62378.1 beta-lactamase [Streptomyces rubellomurinus]